MTRKKVHRIVTMGAELSPDVYGGEKCNRVIPRWMCWCMGDKGDTDTEILLRLAAKHFPPGTKVTIEEPICPNCDELRMPTTTGHADKCHCGFDWKQWTLDEYS